jgi:hypothetical protein
VREIPPVELLIKLAVLAFAVWAFWVVFRTRYAFVVRVGGFIPRAVKGTVTAAFLEQVRRVCVEHGVHCGTVRGVVRGRRIALDFSNFPPGAQQQLRNWWALSGWPAAPSRDRGPPRRA